MKRIVYLGICLLVASTLVLAAPASADDDPPEEPDVCVKFSLNPPGATVDPWCYIPPPVPPQP